MLVQNEYTPAQLMRRAGSLLSIQTLNQLFHCVSDNDIQYSYSFAGG
jgi:hypothetical protein